MVAISGILKTTQLKAPIFTMTLHMRTCEMNQLIERLAYWEGLLGSDDDFETVSGGDVETAAFEECGSVFPYVIDTYSHSIDQVQG